MVRRQKMGGGKRPPKGKRIHKRTVKAGLVKTPSGKLVKAKEAVRRGEAIKARGKEAEERKRILLRERRKREIEKYSRLNEEIMQWHIKIISGGIEGEERKLEKFIRKHKETLIKILSGEIGPGPSTGWAIGTHTKEHIKRLLEKLDLDYNPYTKKIIYFMSRNEF